MRKPPITVRFIIITAALFLLPLPAFAEIKTVTQTVQQSIGSNQSSDDARTAGIAKAKREALEQFGTYIENITIVKNSHLDSDEIIALTAGVTKAEVIKQKNYIDGDAFGIEITVKVELDTDVLEKSLKRLLADRNHLKDLTAARVREKKLLAQIAALQKQDKKQGKTKQQAAKLKKDFQSASQGLTAVEWFDKAVALWQDGKYSDPEAAIGYLDKAIRLNSDDAKAFMNRGIAYNDLKQYQRAIADYDQAIRLQPDYALAFYNRGRAYSDLKQYQIAIADYDQAIRLNPELAKAFNNRGNVYFKLKQYQSAIADYDQAIRQQPDHAGAFNSRGVAYTKLKQYQRAIADYDAAIRLNPDDAIAFMNRGIAYSSLEQYQSAIADYDKAIRLNPDFAEAFYLRGFTYRFLEQNQRAIADCDSAIRLNPDFAEAFYLRGNAYKDLEQYQSAIVDYEQAIRLQPDDAEAFENRGFAYILSGNNIAGCKDLRKACGMGVCDGLEAVNAKGLCR